MPAPRAGEVDLSQPRARGNTANLKSLAESQVGSDFAAGLERVLESDGAAAESYFDEPGLVELAQEAAPDLQPEIPDIHAHVQEASPADYGGIPSDDPDVELPPPSVAKEVSGAQFEMPRAPGPHGPSSRTMTRILAIAAPVIVGLSLAHTFAEGGFDAALVSGKRVVAAGGETGGTGGEDTDVVLEDDSLRLDIPPDLPPPPKDCPEHAAAITDAYCMDVAEYPGRRRMPITAVTIRQAATACEQKAGRLCSLAEWQRACGGAKARAYPYGATIRRDACNTASIAGFPQEVATGASRPECVTAEGVHDLVGNVGEWVAEGIAVGGDSSTPPKQANCKSRGKPPKGFSGTDLGFRCCYDR
jgi:hypothetical protein